MTKLVTWLCIFFVVRSLSAQAAFVRNYSADPSRGLFLNSDYKTSYQEREDRQIISFSGTLPEGFGTAFGAALRMLKPNKTIILKLDSEGGNGWAFNHMIEFIRKYSPNSRIIAYVPRGAECTSGCFLAFLKADLRLASSRATFGFHSSHMNGKKTEGSERDLKKAGINKNFLKFLIKQRVFQSLDVTYFSSEEVYNQNSMDGIIEDDAENINLSSFLKNKIQSSVPDNFLRRIGFLFVKKITCECLFF